MLPESYVYFECSYIKAYYFYMIFLGFIAIVLFRIDNVCNNTTRISLKSIFPVTVLRWGKKLTVYGCSSSVEMNLLIASGLET